MQDFFFLFTADWVQHSLRPLLNSVDFRQLSVNSTLLTLRVSGRCFFPRSATNLRKHVSDRREDARLTPSLHLFEGHATNSTNFIQRFL